MRTTRRRAKPAPKPDTVRHRGHRVSAAALRRALAERGLTQRELSKKARVSEATISHALAGQYLDPGTLRKLARTLTGIPVIETAAASRRSPLP